MQISQPDWEQRSEERKQLGQSVAEEVEPERFLASNAGRERKAAKCVSLALGEHESSQGTARAHQQRYASTVRDTAVDQARGTQRRGMHAEEPGTAELEEYREEWKPPLPYLSSRVLCQQKIPRNCDGPKLVLL